MIHETQKIRKEDVRKKKKTSPYLRETAGVPLRVKKRTRERKQKKTFGRDKGFGQIGKKGKSSQGKKMQGILQKKKIRSMVGQKKKKRRNGNRSWGSCEGDERELVS